MIGILEGVAIAFGHVGLCWKNQTVLQVESQKISWARRRVKFFPEHVVKNVRWVFSDVCQSLGDKPVIYIWYILIKIEYVQLAGGCKRFLYVYPPIWGNDPLWLIFFQMVETTNWSTSTRFWWMFHFPMKFIHEFPNLFGFLSALAKQIWRQVVGGNFFCADIMARRCVEVRFFGIGVTHLHLWGIHSSTQTIDVWYISLHLP